MKIIKIIEIVLLLTLCCNNKSSETTRKAEKNYPLAEKIEILSKDIANCFDEPIIECWDSFSSDLDSLSIAISDEINKSYNPQEIVQKVRAVVFDTLKIGFDKNEDRVDNCLPQLVFKTRTGSCLGIGLFLLLLGERLGLPLYGVLVPTHFFVRYDDNSCCINLEPIKSGESFDDSWYLNKYKPDNGRKLNNLKILTVEQLISVTHYSIGNVFLTEEKYDQAIKQYRSALGLWPDFTEAAGNLAVALDLTGKSSDALKVIGKIDNLSESSSELSKNKGILLLKNRLYEKALKQYTVLLEKNPNDPDVMYGLGVSYFYLKRYPDARNYLETALQIKPDLERARQLILLME